MSKKRTFRWTPEAALDIKYWKKNDIPKFRRVKQLLDNILENPFQGIGKPEPLRFGLSGIWSRRITQEHRLVYSVSEKELIIYNCRFHYKK